MAKVSTREGSTVAMQTNSAVLYILVL
jgi:hypothetical protein